MRNVPIGAGRRKNKHLASQYRQIIVTSDGIPFPTSRVDTAVSSGHQHVPSLDSSAVFRSSTTHNNGTVLKFGPDTPLCESMETMLNLRDQKRGADHASSISCVEYGEEPSLCGSTVTNNGRSTQGNESSSEHNNNTSNWMQCYPVPPWVLPWNPGWNNVQSSAPMYSTGPTAMQWCPTPMLAIQGSINPLQLVSAASYWSGAPLWAAGTTGTLSIGSNVNCLSPSSSTGNSGSPTLGKHTRDTVFTDEEKLSEKCVLVPKTIRIDDPDEASRSPIWGTFTIKPSDKQQCVSNGDVLKKVGPNGEGEDRVLVGASHILEANPAAISRARAFQESI